MNKSEAGAWGKTVIATEWPEFKELDLAEVKARMRSPIIFDGRNWLDPEKVRAHGIEYYGIGRPQVEATAAFIPQRQSQFSLSSNQALPK
ncbi:MAG: UDP binding domain-containing protein [Akkermansiaceae bacterium]